MVHKTYTQPLNAITVRRFIYKIKAVSSVISKYFNLQASFICIYILWIRVKFFTYSFFRITADKGKELVDKTDVRRFIITIIFYQILQYRQGFPLLCHSVSAETWTIIKLIPFSSILKMNYQVVFIDYNYVTRLYEDPSLT